MHKLLFVLLVSAVTPGLSQNKITWKTLKDVEFSDKYSEEEEAYYFYPEFGPTVKNLEGTHVYLTGYMLVMDRKRGIYVLSQNSYAACFFCGNSGPESIVELKLKPDHPKFRMDQIVTMQGKFKLNQDDVYQCNYILEEAEVYEE